VNCPHCGKPAPGRNALCLFCSKPIREGAPCRSCAAVVPPQAPRCFQCGAEVGAAPTAPAATIVLPEELPPRHPVVKDRGNPHTRCPAVYVFPVLVGFSLWAVWKGYHADGLFGTLGWGFLGLLLTFAAVSVHMLNDRRIAWCCVDSMALRALNGVLTIAFGAVSVASILFLVPGLGFGRHLETKGLGTLLLVMFFLLAIGCFCVVRGLQLLIKPESIAKGEQDWGALSLRNPFARDETVE